MEMFDLRTGLLVPIVLVATLATCDDPMGPAEHKEPQVIETTVFDGTLEIALSDFTKTDTGLYYRDISTGEGEATVAADTVNIYFGAWLSDGTSLDPGEIIFVRGTESVAAKTLPSEGGVIPGFDQGIEGMKLGGIRQIIVPPSLAYGNNWVGNVIPPGSIMVFRAHLLRLNHAIYVTQ